MEGWRCPKIGRLQPIYIPIFANQGLITVNPAALKGALSFVAITRLWLAAMAAVATMKPSAGAMACAVARAFAAKFA